MRDSAIVARSRVVSDAGLPHRNASVGNILEGTRTVRRLRYDMMGAGAYVCLQGTWQFMSTRLLTNRRARHTITDDLESLFFVTMWMALHWIKHGSPGDHFIGIGYIFGQEQEYSDDDDDDIVVGGAGKLQMYKLDHSILEVEFYCRPFNGLGLSGWSLPCTSRKGGEVAGRASLVSTSLTSNSQ